MPSRGIQSLRKNGRQCTSTAISGLSASAFSRRCLPMKHHGQTTSETTSMRTGGLLGIVGLLFGASLTLGSLGGNHPAAHHALHQAGEIIAVLQRRQRDIGGDLVVGAVW